MLVMESKDSMLEDVESQMDSYRTLALEAFPEVDSTESKSDDSFV
jgi:hypothetical protein